MCDKCDGRGIVYDPAPGQNWYGTGFDYEPVVELLCDCEAGEAGRLRDQEEAKRRQLAKENNNGLL